MKLSAITQNTNFGNIYVTSVPKSRQKELEKKVSSLGDKTTLVDASDLYKSIDMQTANCVVLTGIITNKKPLCKVRYLKDQADRGKKIDYILTDVDAESIKRIPEEERAEYLSTKDSVFLEYNAKKGVDEIINNIEV